MVSKQTKKWSKYQTILYPFLLHFFACKPNNSYIYLAFFERDQVRKIDEMMPQIRNPD